MKLYGPLDNYIQMHRRRVGLSQAELSTLISLDQRATLSRYEQGLRLPAFEAALGLEIVLNQPIQELFAGVTERVRDNVGDRARDLLETLGDAPSKEALLKLELLSKLAHPDDYHVIPLWEERS